METSPPSVRERFPFDLDHFRSCKKERRMYYVSFWMNVQSERFFFQYFCLLFGVYGWFPSTKPSWDCHDRFIIHFPKKAPCLKIRSICSEEMFFSAKVSLDVEIHAISTRWVVPSRWCPPESSPMVLRAIQFCHNVLEENDASREFRSPGLCLVLEEILLSLLVTCKWIISLEEIELCQSSLNRSLREPWCSMIQRWSQSSGDSLGLRVLRWIICASLGRACRVCVGGFTIGSRDLNERNDQRPPLQVLEWRTLMSLSHRWKSGARRWRNVRKHRNITHFFGVLSK